MTTRYQYIYTTKNQYGYRCNKCQLVYTSKGNHRECSGYYKPSKTTYPLVKEFYESQTLLYTKSRTINPFFITFDCETKTIEGMLRYYCHSVTLYCRNSDMAKEVFGSDIKGNTLNDMSMYFLNTRESMKYLFERLTPVLQNYVSPILKMVRKHRWEDCVTDNDQTYRSYRIFKASRV